MILRFPHNVSNSQLGLLMIILPLLGGSFWLYNAFRLGKLKWKPTGPANPKLVSLVILIGILAAVVLLAIIE